MSLRADVRGHGGIDEGAWWTHDADDTVLGHALGIFGPDEEISAFTLRVPRAVIVVDQARQVMHVDTALRRLHIDGQRTRPDDAH